VACVAPWGAFSQNMRGRGSFTGTGSAAGFEMNCITALT
jgi:hypothetical protein